MTVRRAPPRCEAITASSGERCKNRPACKSRWGGRKVCEAHQNSLRFIAVEQRRTASSAPQERAQPVYGGNVIPFRPRARPPQAQPLWRRAAAMDPEAEA